MPDKKEYRSAVRSRRMIKQAFLELLKERRLDKITVTHIVERADINRSTFYAHYRDIYDLADKITDEILSETSKLVNNLDLAVFFENPKPFLYDLFQIGVAHIELYRISETSEMLAKQFQRLRDFAVIKAIAYMHLPANLTNSNEFLIHTNFFVGGIFNIYQLWASGKLECSMEEIVEQVASLVVSNAHIYCNLTQNTANCETGV